MASTLSGPNIEEEYMWSVTLDGTNKEYSWSPKEPSDEDEEDAEDPSCKPNHRLLIKTAILHPEAAKDEVTMLQIETKGYKEEKVKTPFVAMKSGSNLQQYVDLLVPDLATIKMVHGSGPITLLGSHCVDFYDYRNYGNDETLDDEEDAESSEDDEMDEEEQETVAVKEESIKEEAADEKEDPKEGAKKKTPKKDTPKKETSKKDTPKKDAKEKEEKEDKSPVKDAKKTESPAVAKKTPDSKKRKQSAEEAVAEKKRKKSGEK
jgi:hypothetical protein